MADLSREQDIWAWFKANTRLPDEAIAGIMGNMQAESSCEPCRKQGDMTDDRRISKAYALAVDAGDTSAFFSGKIGWGLCQWTYPSRCRGLYDLCTEKNVSIADLGAQLEYLMAELQSDEYSGLYTQLLACKEYSVAADIFCRQFERPLFNNVTARTNFAMGFYTQYHGKQSSAITDDKATAIAFLEDLKNQIEKKLKEFKS